MIKVLFIVGGICLIVGILANVIAFFGEKSLRKKMYDSDSK